MKHSHWASLPIYGFRKRYTLGLLHSILTVYVCGGIPIPTGNSLGPCWISLWFNSILTHPFGESIRSHRLRVQFYKPTLHPPSDASHKSSDQLEVGQITWSSHDLLSLVVINLLDWLTELSNPFFQKTTSLSQKILKDMNQQPDEEIHRAKSWTNEHLSHRV